jgi:saccharopine dehydrogenase-like NADP-dependent oxidoreductase
VLIAVLGAGAMGGAVVRLLSRHDDIEPLVLDANGARAENLVAELGRGVARGFDATAGTDALAGALAGAEAVAVCLPYRLNLDAMRAALTARVPYADLGGLFHMTRRQLELDAPLREAGIAAVVGIGACPGLSNVFARMAAERMQVRSIDIVDGSIEEGQSGFAVPYSAETIIDEYMLPAYVLEDGELREVPAGSGEIRYRFPEPVGEMAAFYTLHSELATLPQTIQGVRDVRWRLALPPPIHDGFRSFVDLGLGSTDPVDTPNGPVVPRELLLALLARLPPPEGPSRETEFLDVGAKGLSDGHPARFLARAKFVPQREGIGAGAFGTAIPIATAVRWLAEGRVPPGVHPPENAFDAEAFVRDLEAEGVEVTLSMDLEPS